MSKLDCAPAFCGQKLVDDLQELMRKGYSGELVFKIYLYEGRLKKIVKVTEEMIGFK